MQTEMEMKMQKNIRAGVSRQIISPPPGVYQIGFGDRTKGNLGIHDDLTATAAVFDDGQQRVAIVACDLLAINSITAGQVQAQVNLPVLISCSHTHSGPITYAGKRAPHKNRDYVKLLVDRIVQAICEAEASLEPATVAWSSGQTAIAVNRRERQANGKIEIGVHPDGPVDRSLGIVQARREDGSVLMTLVNFACHGTVLGPLNLLVSADWPGAMRGVVEADTGAPCLFIQGATGDLNPVVNVTQSDWSAMRDLGEQVGHAALETFSQLAPLECAPIRYQRADTWLPLQASTLKSLHVYRKMLSRFAKVPSVLVDPILNRRYPWKTTVEAHDGVWKTPMNVQVVRLGELAYVGYGMEVFTEIGMAVKAFSPAHHTIFASLTTGCTGYLPTSAEHALGGYEVEQTPYFYRLPGILDPGAADLALAETRRLLEQVWS